MRSSRIVYVCDTCKYVEGKSLYLVQDRDDFGHMRRDRDYDPNRIIIEMPCRQQHCACTDKDRGHACRTAECRGTMKMEIVDERPYC